MGSHREALEREVGECLRTFRGHEGLVNSAVFSPDAAPVLTAMPAEFCSDDLPLRRIVVFARCCRRLSLAEALRLVADCWFRGRFWLRTLGSEPWTVARARGSTTGATPFFAFLRSGLSRRDQEVRLLDLDSDDA